MLAQARAAARSWGLQVPRRAVGLVGLQPARRGQHPRCRGARHLPPVAQRVAVQLRAGHRAPAAPPGLSHREQLCCAGACQACPRLWRALMRPGSGVAGSGEARPLKPGLSRSGRVSLGREDAPAQHSRLGAAKGPGTGRASGKLAGLPARAQPRLRRVWAGRAAPGGLSSPSACPSPASSHAARCLGEPWALWGAGSSMLHRRCQAPRARAKSCSACCDSVA